MSKVQDGLLEKANKIVDLMLTGVEKGMEALPGLLEEYIVLHAVDAAMGALFSAITLITSIKLFKHCYNKIKESKTPEGEVFICGFGTMLLFCIIFVSGNMFYIHMQNGVQLIVAPKAYLIETIRK